MCVILDPHMIEWRAKGKGPARRYTLRSRRISRDFTLAARLAAHDRRLSYAIGHDESSIQCHKSLTKIERPPDAIVMRQRQSDGRLRESATQPKREHETPIVKTTPSSGATEIVTPAPLSTVVIKLCDFYYSRV
ncbi:hypothetical protein Sjap_007423 [Stephania japonica]|uniref:Uncharacterized protein n=1 Tax=Stephania japonica TaxID=461633 RepID=A0AAP0JMZ2_9MAGN